MAYQVVITFYDDIPRDIVNEFVQDLRGYRIVQDAELQEIQFNEQQQKCPKCGRNLATNCGRIPAVVSTI